MRIRGLFSSTGLVRVTGNDSPVNSELVQLRELDSALRVTVSCRVVDRDQYLNERGAYALLDFC
jgi:hypothetical protein